MKEEVVIYDTNQVGESIEMIEFSVTTEALPDRNRPHLYNRLILVN